MRPDIEGLSTRSDSPEGPVTQQRCVATPHSATDVNYQLSHAHGPNRRRLRILQLLTHAALDQVMRIATLRETHTEAGEELAHDQGALRQGKSGAGAVRAAEGWGRRL